MVATTRYTHCLVVETLHRAVYLRVFLYNMRIMSNYDYNSRDAARRRQDSRRGQSDGSDSYNRRYSDTGSQRGGRGGRSASLSDLHQVSPQMRERYGVSDNPRSGLRNNRNDDNRDYYDDPRASRRGGYDDWRSPSVDPIGGRSLNGQSGRRNGSGGNGGGIGAMLSQINLPIIIGLVVVAILLVAVIVLAVDRCSGGSASVENQGSQTEQSSDSSGTTESGSESSSESGSSSGSTSGSSAQQPDNGIDRKALVKIVDEDVADKLIKRAETSEDAKWIAQNPDKLAMDGDTVQAKLLKLAADEPAAQSYVRNFADKYPMKTPQNGQVKTVATGRNIPRFYQWDELWGYTVYSGTAFGLTGCCPTCLAMVYQGITGNNDLSPYDMGELAVRDGYASEYEGTYANFLVEEAHAIGLPVTEIDVTEKAMKKALENGQVVIVNFAPGLFTEYGHYVVITGQTQDGSLIMNDPYSEERSNQTWDIGTIVNESQGLYAYG